MSLELPGGLKSLEVVSSLAPINHHLWCLVLLARICDSTALDPPAHPGLGAPRVRAALLPLQSHINNVGKKGTLAGAALCPPWHPGWPPARGCWPPCEPGPGWGECWQGRRSCQRCGAAAQHLHRCTVVANVGAAATILTCLLKVAGGPEDMKRSTEQASCQAGHAHPASVLVLLSKERVATPAEVW